MTVLTRFMKTIQTVEDEIIEEFNRYEDIDSKYRYLFELGDGLQEMDPSNKNDENLVDGCQSKLWFKIKKKDGKYHLQVDSDSMVIKGIAALLVRLVEGRSSEEIQTISLNFIDELRIWKLASDRNSGLKAILNHLKEQVAEASTAENQKGK